MRLRSRVFYKILTLLGTLLLIIVIFFNIMARESGPDKYITIIAEKSLDKFKSLPAAQGLLNLTNFEFLIGNNICQLFKKELLGEVLVKKILVFTKINIFAIEFQQS